MHPKAGVAGLHLGVPKSGGNTSKGRMPSGGFWQVVDCHIRGQTIVEPKDTRIRKLWKRSWRITFAINRSETRAKYKDPVIDIAHLTAKGCAHQILASDKYCSRDVCNALPNCCISQVGAALERRRAHPGHTVRYYNAGQRTAIKGRGPDGCHIIRNTNIDETEAATERSIANIG